MSHKFEAVLAELAKRFDRIILDSPPLQVVTDAVILAKRADGAILVVSAGKTLREEARRAAKQLKDVDAPIFGVIVNAIEPDSRSGYYYSYYGYTEKEAQPQTPAA
jgi:Mrp family chromosome partitioning ATPase